MIPPAILKLPKMDRAGARESTGASSSRSLGGLIRGSTYIGTLGSFWRLAKRYVSVLAASAATPFGVSWTLGIALVVVDLGRLFRLKVGAPAGLIADDGEGVIAYAVVLAEALCLVDAQVLKETLVLPSASPTVVVDNSLADPLAVFSVEQKSAAMFWAKHMCGHSSARRRRLPMRPVEDASGAMLDESGIRARVFRPRAFPAQDQPSVGSCMAPIVRRVLVERCSKSSGSWTHWEASG